MAAEESKKLSGEVVLVGSSLNTVESLRGRLLTERQASRVANEEAKLLENKLKELERKLKEETKLSGKAEKKLRFLMKKLHSLTFTLDPSQELPSSSDSSGLTGLFSSTASSSVTTSSSSANNNTEDAESQFQNKIPDIDSASAPISQSAKTSDDDNDDAQSCSSSWRNETDGRSDGSWAVDNSMALVPEVWQWWPLRAAVSDES